MSEVPPEIVALRRRLAELEQIADAHSAFNAALRGKSPPEQPEVEQPNLDFNSALRKAAGKAPPEPTAPAATDE